MKFFIFFNLMSKYVALQGSRMDRIGFGEETKEITDLLAYYICHLWLKIMKIWDDKRVSTTNLIIVHKHKELDWVNVDERKL